MFIEEFQKMTENEFAPTFVGLKTVLSFWELVVGHGKAHGLGFAPCLPVASPHEMLQSYEIEHVKSPFLVESMIIQL